MKYQKKKKTNKFFKTFLVYAVNIWDWKLYNN